MLFHFFIWIAEHPPMADNADEQNNQDSRKSTEADKSAPTDVQIHLLRSIIGGGRDNAD
jgi:hypothetical protein